MPFSQVPVTRKPEGIRMGKGKGNIAFYATPVSSGLFGWVSWQLHQLQTCRHLGSQTWVSGRRIHLEGPSSLPDLL